MSILGTISQLFADEFDLDLYNVSAKLDHHFKNILPVHRPFEKKFHYRCFFSCPSYIKFE